MALDELGRLGGEHVGQVAAVAARDRAVAIEIPLIVGLPSSGKSCELVETAAVRMIARIERAVVPFADEAGCVSGALQEFSDRHLAQRQAIEAARLERVDYSGAMRVAAGHQRRSRGRAYRRGGVVLGQADAFA